MGEHIDLAFNIENESELGSELLSTLAARNLAIYESPKIRNPSTPEVGDYSSPLLDNLLDTAPLDAQSTIEASFNELTMFDKHGTPQMGLFDSRTRYQWKPYSMPSLTVERPEALGAVSSYRKHTQSVRNPLMFDAIPPDDFHVPDAICKPSDAVSTECETSWRSGVVSSSHSGVTRSMSVAQVPMRRRCPVRDESAMLAQVTCEPLVLDLDNVPFDMKRWAMAMEQGGAGLSDLHELRDKFVSDKKSERRNAFYTRMRSLPLSTKAKKTGRGRINAKLSTLDDAERRNVDNTIITFLVDYCMKARKELNAANACRFDCKCDRLGAAVHRS